MTKLHHQEQCPWCGLRADINDDGRVVLYGLWRPVHPGTCTEKVNLFLRNGHPMLPYYKPSGAEPDA